MGARGHDDVLGGLQAVFALEPVHQIGVIAQQEQGYPAAPVFHAGIGGQGGGQGHQLELFEFGFVQRLHQRLNAVGKPEGRGLALGALNHLALVKIINHPVGKGSAGVNAQSQQHTVNDLPRVKFDSFLGQTPGD